MCTQSGNVVRAKTSHIGVKLGSDSSRSPTVPNTTVAILPVFASLRERRALHVVRKSPAHLSRFGAVLHCRPDITVVGTVESRLQARITHKPESVKVFSKYFKNPDATAMSYLYEEIAARVEKGLRPNPESVRFIYELVAAEDPRAKQLGERDNWDLSLIDEIRQSGFLDQLYRK